MFFQQNQLSPKTPDVIKLEWHGENDWSINLSSTFLPKSNLADYLEEGVNQLIKKEGK